MADRDLRQTSAPPDPAQSAQADPVERGHLRDQIDAGKFHDKVAAPDPATSPLGTDDEAAGVPTRASAVRTTDPNTPAYAPSGQHSDDVGRKPGLAPGHGHDQGHAAATPKGPLIAIALVVAAFLFGIVLVLTSG
jgi:hypothetical protein